MSILDAVKVQAKKVLPAGPAVRTLPFGIGRGLRMTVDLHGGHVGMYLGLYEIELNRHMRRLCPKGTSCFDIGGQMGYDALVLGKLANAPVVSVECEARWCDVIRHNIQANPSLEPIISVRQAFIDRLDHSASGHLTLDTLVDETFVPGFVKIDIEGAEVAALQGATRLLSEKPGFLIEVHSAQLERECDDLLRGAGYSPIVAGPRRWLPDHRPSVHNRWLIAQSPAVH